MSGVLWLEGLVLEGFPVAALVAYGTLRVLVEEEGLDHVHLVFRDPHSRPVPGLVGVGKRDLFCRLARRLRRTPPLPQGLPEGEKLENLPFDEMARLAGQDPRWGRFLPALLLPRAGDQPFRTPLDTSKGQQSLPKALWENWEAARKPNLLKGLSRVLFGQGVLLEPKEEVWVWGRRGYKATRKRKPLEFGLIGWHPTQYRQWAESPREPNSVPFKDKVRIHPVATLLAWEALPLFPLYPGVDGVRAAGILDPEGRPSLLLPTPGQPVSLRTLRALLLQAPLALENRGFWPKEVGLWRSPRVGSRRQDEPYPVFMWAEPFLREPLVGAKTPGGSRKRV